MRRTSPVAGCQDLYQQLAQAANPALQALLLGTLTHDATETSDQDHPGLLLQAVGLPLR